LDGRRSRSTGAVTAGASATTAQRVWGDLGSRVGCCAFGAAAAGAISDLPRDVLQPRG
jgi:hypothetical protein